MSSKIVCKEYSGKTLYDTSDISKKEKKKRFDKEDQNCNLEMLQTRFN
jgi:hypothetical protein